MRVESRMIRPIGLTIFFLSLIAIVAYWFPKSGDVIEAQSAKESVQSGHLALDASEDKEKSAARVHEKSGEPFAENTNDDLGSTSSSYKKRDQSPEGSAAPVSRM